MIFSWKGKEVFSFSKKSTATEIGNLDSLAEFLSSMSSQGKVTKANAYRQHVWVYSAINSIALNVARVPFKLYKKPARGQTELEQITEGPAFQLFNDVNAQLSRFQLWEGTEIFKNMRGEAFWRVEVAGNLAVGLEFLKPTGMKAIIKDKILIGWEYRDGATQVVFLPDEIIHFKYFNPFNMWRGLSPLDPAWLSIEVDDSARRFDQKILDNGSNLGGVIEIKEGLTDAQSKRLLKQIERRHKGIDNAGKIGVIEGGTYKELKLTPKDISYIEQRNLTKQEMDFDIDGDIDLVKYYTYNSNGNLTQERLDRGNNGSIDAVGDYTYNSKGDLSEYVWDSDIVEYGGAIAYYYYDGNGNIYRRENISWGYASYSVSNVFYTYGANGKISKEEEENSPTAFPVIDVT